MDIVEIGTSVPAAPLTSRPWNGSAEFYKPSFQTLSTCAPEEPVRTRFAPFGQPLAPARAIVANSSAASPKMHTFSSKPVIPTNHSTFAKSGIRHTGPSADVSTTPTMMAPYPLACHERVTVPPVHLTSPPSSAGDVHLGGVPGGTPILVGGKRRLGMGRGSSGYSNKKFKTPGL